MEYWGEIRRRFGVVRTSCTARFAEQRSDFASVRTELCVKTALCFVVVGTAGIAAARPANYFAYASSDTDIRANDGISWNSLGFNGSVLLNPTNGTSMQGIRFHVEKPAPGAMRIEDV